MTFSRPTLSVMALVLATLSAACAADASPSDRSGAPAAGSRLPASDTRAEDAPSTASAPTSTAPASPAPSPSPAATAPTKPAAPVQDLSPSGVVTRAYELAFERAPDAGGLAFWVGRLNEGTTKLGVLLALVQSEEFVSLHAAKSNAAYVDYLYTRFLRRAPSAAESTYWVDALTNGSTRPALAAAFVGSAEFASNVNPDFAFFF